MSHPEKESETFEEETQPKLFIFLIVVLRVVRWSSKFMYMNTNNSTLNHPIKRVCYWGRNKHPLYPRERIFEYKLSKDLQMLYTNSKNLVEFYTFFDDVFTFEIRSLVLYNIILKHCFVCLQHISCSSSGTASLSYI